MHQHEIIIIGAGIAGWTSTAYRACTDSERQMKGHWAFSPGGSPVALLTGKLAANSILKSRGEE